MAGAAGARALAVAMVTGRRRGLLDLGAGPAGSAELVSARALPFRASEREDSAAPAPGPSEFARGPFAKVREAASPVHGRGWGCYLWANVVCKWAGAGLARFPEGQVLARGQTGGSQEKAGW